MTLKKCTVTKLDDVFWRVDFDEKISIGSSDLKSPQVVKRFGDRWFFQGFPGDDASDPDELLRLVGLTRHDEPETAEERVRKLVGESVNGNAVVDMLAAHVIYDDLRAILAELDRVRDGLTRRECWEAEYVVLSEKYGKLFMEHEFAKQELDRLRAQRPVDAEAVLAPVREAQASFQRQMDSHAEEVRANVVRCQFADALWHDTRCVGLGLANSELIRALAEAEKIGRGE